MASIPKQLPWIASATTLMSIGISLPALAFSFELPSGFNTALAEQYETSLYFYSQPGDWVGQGREWFYGPTDGKFTVSRNFDNGASFNFDNFALVGFSRATWWNASFAAPFERTLTPGYYNGATRFPFQTTSKPGLSFTGDGRGCNRSGGRFEILDILYGSNGTLSKLDAVFAQYCENELATGSPALFGRVRYKASQVSVKDPTPVPEPANWIGLASFGILAVWKRRQSAGEIKAAQ